MNLAALPDGFDLSRNAVGLDCASMSVLIEIRAANGQITFASFIGERPGAVAALGLRGLIGQAGGVNAVASGGCHRVT